MFTRTEEIEYFNHRSEKKSTRISLIRVDDFSSIKTNIDASIGEIVNGEIMASDVATSKQNIRNMMTGKTDNQKYGIIAEFFTHFIVKGFGLKQESIFSNLEENSMKKGFDGLYSDTNKLWLMESKSGYSRGLLHKHKIREAFIDLEQKITGQTANNPFRNAAFHMIVVRKDPKLKLLDLIKKLSFDYTERNFPKLEDFSVIPVSTLFVEHTQTIDDIVADMSSIVGEMEYEEIMLLCIDNEVSLDFLAYIGA